MNRWNRVFTLGICRLRRRFSWIRPLAAWLCLGALLTLTVSAASPVGFAEIRGHVWHDVNENGLRDAGEPGLGNVLIILASCAGAPLHSTYTDDVGAYRFSGLAPGDYWLSETDPEGFSSTTPNLVAIHISEGAIVTQDFGDTRLLPGCWHAVDGRIWHDVNANGRREATEEPLQGVSLRVLDLNNALVGITASNSYGAYKVHGVPPERYYLVLIPPDGIPFSKAPLYWGVDLRGCVPPVIDLGLQRHLEAEWSCESAGDVVGPGNALINPDGRVDGGIGVWLNATSQNPLTITQVLVEAEKSGQRQHWDTDPNTEDWAVAVVDPESHRLLNPEMAFRYPITGHTPLLLYISDTPESPVLQAGTLLTVTIQIAQGEPWTTSLRIPNCISPTLASNPLQEGESTLSGTVWILETGAGNSLAGRRAAPGVKLTLKDAASNRIIAEQISDSQGRYRFAALAGWRAYYLTQEILDGYEPVLSAYWGAAVTDNSEVIINLENRPMPGGRMQRLYLPYITAIR